MSREHKIMEKRRWILQSHLRMGNNPKGLKNSQTSNRKKKETVVHYLLVTSYQIVLEIVEKKSPRVILKEKEIGRAHV